MPESHSRKRPSYTPPGATKRPAKLAATRWVAPVMVTCWILGLAWIVVFYLAPNLPYVRDLGNWNLAVGMGFIALGFIFSTKWE